MTPPVVAITQINLSVRKLPTGCWLVTCPEWQCDLITHNATKAVALLLAEIETHNDEIKTGRLAWWKTADGFAKQTNGTRLRKEAWPKPPPSFYGQRRVEVF